MPHEHMRSIFDFERGARAVGFFAITAAALIPAPGVPTAIAVATAAGVALLSFVAPALAVVSFVIAISVPLARADPLLGIIVLLSGIACTPWLVRANAARLFAIALSVALTAIHAEWAPVVVAALVLDEPAAAVCAAVCAIAVEAVGFGLGRISIGAQAAGGTVALLRGAGSGLQSFSLSGLAETLVRSATSRLLPALLRVGDPLLLLTQPAVWALGALAATQTARMVRTRGSRSIATAAATVAGVTVIFAGTVSVSALVRGPVPLDTLIVTAIVSAAVATACSLGYEALSRVTGHASSEPADAPEPAATYPPAPTPGLLRLTERLGAAGRGEQERTITAAVLAGEWETHAASPKAETDAQAGLGRLLDTCGAKGLCARTAFVAVFDQPSRGYDAAPRLRAELDSCGLTLARMGLVTGEIVVEATGWPIAGPALEAARAAAAAARPGETFVSPSAARSAAEAVEPEPADPSGPSVSGPPVPRDRGPGDG